jgi:hypothetical protein
MELRGGGWLCAIFREAVRAMFSTASYRAMLMNPLGGGGLQVQCPLSLLGLGCEIDVLHVAPEDGAHSRTWISTRLTDVCLMSPISHLLHSSGCGHAVA